MPQQRLQFSRKVVRRSIQTTSLTSHNDSAASISGSPTPVAMEATPLSPSLVSTPPLQPLPMKQRTSWVFRHMPDPDTQTKYHNKDNREEWRCRYCTRTYLTSGSTSGPKKHLIQVHGLTEEDDRDSRAQQIQTSMEQTFAIAEAHPQKRRRLDPETIQQDRLEVLWVRAVASCNLSFRLVESTEFRAFLIYLNQEVENTLAKSHTDVQKWVIRQYEALKDIVKTSLHKALSKIHLCIDLWTSPNSLAILGIVARYIDEAGELKSTVLAMKEVDGEHTGENLAKYVLEAIYEYDLAKKLGYFVMDNAENNDTMITSLSASLRRDLKLNYDPKHHRLRCQGHIINLSVKSFLFVTDKENIQEDEAIDTMKVTLEEIEQWRKKGPLGKLHNFVVWLAQST
jgi:hypothetical protein